MRPYPRHQPSVTQQAERCTEEENRRIGRDPGMKVEETTTYIGSHSGNTLGSFFKTSRTSLLTNLFRPRRHQIICPTPPPGSKVEKNHAPGTNNNLINPLIEPPLTHDKPALRPRLLPPTILHPPPHAFPIHDMHARQHHSVRHGALAGAQACRLVEAEADVEAELVVDQVRVHDAGGGGGELADVAAEEDGLVGAQGGDAGLFDRLWGLSASESRGCAEVEKGLEVWRGEWNDLRPCRR